MSRPIPPTFVPAAGGQSYRLSPGAVLWQSALTAYAPLGSKHGSDTAEGRGKARRFTTSLLAAASAAGMSANDVQVLQDLAAHAASTDDANAVRGLLGHCERAVSRLSPEVLRNLLSSL